MATTGRDTGMHHRCARVAVRLSAGLLSVGLFAPYHAQAGVADFLAGCMAERVDMGGLAARLDRQGYAEVDPAQGPPGPALAADTTGRRLWMVRHPVDGQIDSFTGYAPPGPGRPFEVCWHISRPGESAAEALPALQSRYPVIQGTTETGAAFFFGGYERWQSRSGPVVVTLGVSWPMRDQPAEGSSLLYVVRAASPA